MVWRNAQPALPLFPSASYRPTQIDDVGKALLHQWFGECPDAAMVCEQQDLIGLAELGKQVERGLAALVIEMQKNIVRDEGQRLRRTGAPATKGDLALPGL
jgi:hypothetical protein